MKKEAKLLLERSANSLVFAIEIFNRPSDRGRIEGVLIFLDHSFEMLLKAAILHKGGKIRENRVSHTIGFDKCVSKALTDGAIKFLTDEQALTLSALNAMRDAAQHHLVDLPESQLYLHAQSALTLFRDIYKKVFKAEIALELPVRILPLSVQAPQDLEAIFSTSVDEIKKILKPGTRKQVDALHRLRGLAILDRVISGEKTHPTDGELKSICTAIKTGKSWQDIFPGVASIQLTTSGQGIDLNLRFTKKEGIPIHVTKEGDGPVVAIKRVNELDFFSLGLVQLSKKLGKNRSETLGIVGALDIQKNPDFFKEITIGTQLHKRYSNSALEYLKQQLPTVNMAEIRAKHIPTRKKARR